MAYIGNDLEVAFQSYLIIDDISSGFDGSETSFTLNVNGAVPVPFPINPQQCLISVAGVIQEPDPTGSSGFNLSGNNIVFSSPPAGSASFFGVVLAGADYVNVGVDFPAGSVAAPSITFVTDKDTGFFSKAANEIGIACAGTEVGVFSSTGLSSGFADGSAASPSIFFTSDTNTGIARAAADELIISAGGVERASFGSSEVVFNDPSNDVDFRVESNGNTHMLFVDGGNDRVGVGTSSPAEELHVAGSFPVIRIEDSDTNHYGQIEASNGNITISADKGNTGGSSIINFLVDNDEKARIDSSGRLLVGTSTATDNTRLDQKLGIVSNSGNSGGIRLTQNPGANAGAAPLIDFRKTRGSTDGSHTIVADGDTLGYIVFGGADGTDNESQAALITAQVDGTPGANDLPGALIFQTTADGASSTTERMRIDSSGNVGIGTTSPVSKLDLGSDTGVKLTLLQNNYSLGVESNELRIASNQSTTFYTGGHSGTERVRIDSSGRLLVGTSSGTYTTEIVNDNEANLAIRTYNNSATNFAGIRLFKARGSAASPTVVSDGDTLNDTLIYGYDGSNFKSAVSIKAQVDGTPGTNDMPGRLTISTTPDGASSPTERVRIDSSGNVGIGETSPDRQFHVKNTTDTTQVKIETTSSSGRAQVQYTSPNGDWLQGIQGAVTTGDFITYTADSKNILWFTGGNEELRLQSGGGISFNGDTAAANALDDYEEGTFTARFNNQDDDATVSHNNQTGYYVKVGTLVHFSVYFDDIDVTSTGSTTFARIYGLPFSALNASQHYSVVNIIHNTILTSSAGGYTNINSSFVIPTDVGSTSTSTFSTGTNFRLMVGGTYRSN